MTSRRKESLPRHDSASFSSCLVVTPCTRGKALLKLTLQISVPTTVLALEATWNGRQCRNTTDTDTGKALALQSIGEGP